MELFSIGHSNHSADKFLQLLKMHDIKMLVDVRSKPQSRFAHFSRDNLMAMVRKNGIDYRFGGMVLGGLNPVSVHASMFCQKVDNLLELAREQRTAIMCSEGKPCECHRAGKIMAYVHRDVTEMVKTTHILPDGLAVDAKVYEGQNKFKHYVIPPEYKPTWEGPIDLKG